MTMMALRVSVIMPAYQSESTIGASISSVLWQTYDDVELVVADDGSTDGTRDIVKGFGDRVRFVERPHTGAAAARNAAISESTGQLLTFCDSDDVLFPNHIKTLVDAHAGNRDIVTANALWMYPNGIVPGRTVHGRRIPAPEDQRMAILQRNFVSPMSIFSRALIEEVGVFSEELEPAEDLAFWLEAIFAGYRVRLQPRPLALYRWSTSGVSGRREEVDAAVARVLEQTARRPDLTDEERRYLDRRLAGDPPSVLVRRGDAAIRSGSYREAARLLGRAARLMPVERPIVWKARLLSVAPGLSGRLLRARQRRLDRTEGVDQSFVR
ncbi:MAG TPA: glycosyltransferase [Thermoleophilaceae bacterium]